MQLPPGVEYRGQVEETANGGASEWVGYKGVRMYTNAFVILDNTKVLLGYKKRGIGMGLFNGFGGKVEKGESPAQAAVRELEEEAGIRAPLQHCGTLFFVVDGADAAFHIDIFSAYEYSGTIAESEEMRPEWFSIQDDLLPPDRTNTLKASTPLTEVELPPVPLKQMWADDEFWFPLMVARRPFVGRADFSADNKMLKWWFGAAPASA